MVSKKEKVKLDNNLELGDLINKALEQDTGTKKAIETLHPVDEEQLDRLTILSTPQEISAHAIVEWEIKALKEKDWSDKFVIEGLSDKFKALKVSFKGTGRTEVSNIFRPEVLRDMFQQGLVPSGGMMPANGMGNTTQMVEKKKGLFGMFKRW